MRLQSKFTLYNTLSKAVIILVFVIIMPVLIKQIAIINTDAQLQEKRDQVLMIIEDVGITSFIEEGSDGTYGSYNLLKEEFISLEQIDPLYDLDVIEDSPRLVESEVVDYRVLSYTFKAEEKQYLLEVGRSLFTIHEIESTLRKFALITLLVITLITILSDIAFTKVLLRPLNRIVAKLHSTKDPSSFRFDRIRTNTTDFNYLDQSIHEMMNRIEDVFIKEREFISNVSHELLTPVSILQSKIENMLTDENLAESIESRLVDSQKTLSRLKNVIRALLLISKIENEQYLKQDNVSITKLIKDVREEIEDRLEVKKITLVSDLQEDHLLSGNESLLHTMVFNLINNAIKYNHTGGNIHISGYKTASGYVLQIQDNGVGIAHKSMPFIFNRFKRFHQPDNESFGLGLPIVKTIADFHQIKIDVRSEPGQGSTFTLTMPYS